MALEIALTFNGNASEAVEFYQKIFKFENPYILKFSQIPPNSCSNIKFNIKDEHKDFIATASFEILGTPVRLCDTTPENKLNFESNFAMSVVSKDPDLTTYFDALAQEGQVVLALGKTFWSEKFGILKDKFGVTWQFSMIK